ncbi:MAG TPA: histidinol-phosphate transaminase [Candidatus Limnocylindrales bacterium]|nr:histidinol-phosphate transaminase [Candidatus Limnocylindrales bacterium]
MTRGKDLVSPRTAAMQGYVPGEQPSDARLVKLNTNENPYACSPLVAEAIQAEARRLHLYPSPCADALRRKAAQIYGVREDQVLVGNGSDELLSILVRACTQPGDAVAYPVPTYSLYRTLAEAAGARTIELPWQGQALPASLAEADARLTFLCSPNSPTGLALPLDEIAAFTRQARGVVVVDEAYVDFGDATALSILQQHPNMMVLRTFSKSFSLAGLRLGLGFAHAELVEELVKIKDSYNVSRLAIAAGVAALEDYDWMRSNVARVRATRARVTARLRAAGYGVRDSSANFLWIDCSAHGGGKAIYERLRQASVLVRFFDQEGLREGIRISIGTDDQMDRALSVLAAA